MNNFGKGDIVGRKSYSSDILFKIVQVYQGDDGQPHASLRGLDVRLLADAPINDLSKASPQQLRLYRQKFFKDTNDCMKRIFARRQIERGQVHMVKDPLMRGQPAAESDGENGDIDFFEVPGRVLHLDGDGEYLDLCLTTYKQLGISAKGLFVPEKEQPKVLMGLLKQNAPDILVVTGHDGLIRRNPDFKDLGSYRTSRHFVESVQVARHYEKSKDELIIFAGACQSHYEAILEAGANFASSPQRVFIHAFDPVFIVEKLAFTSIHEKVAISEVISNTITGTSGVGGVETRGKFRLGMPKSPY